jgi:hypothetical protein
MVVVWGLGAGPSAAFGSITATIVGVSDANVSVSITFVGFDSQCSTAISLILLVTRFL